VPARSRRPKKLWRTPGSRRGGSWLGRTMRPWRSSPRHARRFPPPTVGPPNPALAREEAKRAAQHLLDQARTNADSLLVNA
jgi:hypothetical protein